MLEKTRAEVRYIAATTANETVLRYADALARSPYAQEAIKDAAQETAAEVARSIADERVAHAEEIVRAATSAAEDTAGGTARKVAGETVTGLVAEAETRTLKEVRSTVEGLLKETREEWEQTAAEARRALGAFVQEEAVRKVAETVAETVPPVTEVRIGTAEPSRISGVSHRALPNVLLALGAGCHVLLVGPAGTGKSMMARQAAQAFGQEFHALSLGPTTPMSKVFGYYDAHGNYHGTPFRRAFEHGGLMLLDELDSGHPGLLAELNQALSIRSCAFADGMVDAHPDFRLVATANTYGTGGDRQYVGRQALDAATLDRFVVINLPVDEELEERVALAHAPSQKKQALKVVKQVRRLRALAAEKQLPVMFSPRASIDAAKLLEAGASVEQAVQWRIVRGMSAAHRTALGLEKNK